MARFSLSALLLLLVFPLRVDADLQQSPFSLRFPATFSHFSPFADVAAKGGAATASPFGSSPTLTGIAWGFQPEAFDYQASLNYDFLTFDSGTDLHLATQTLAFDAGELGIFRVALIEFQSADGQTRLSPVEYDFELLGTRLDWSKKFGDYGIGAGLGFTHAETRFSTPALRVSDSEKDNWTFRLGGQRQLGERWLIAAMADYGNGSTDGVQGVAPGLKRYFVEDSEQWVVQTGLAFLITPQAVAHLDYQYGWFGNETEDLQMHRWSAGTDIPLSSWFLLRAGASTDQYGNLGWSGGFAVLPRKGTSINLAYQNGMMPELDREFGKAQMFNLSLSFKW